MRYRPLGIIAFFELKDGVLQAGFAEVSDNKLSILAESAERGEDIDTARANAARERAEARLAAKTAETDVLRAHLALQRAVERLHIASLV